jgi:hypothetical protein
MSDITVSFGAAGTGSSVEGNPDKEYNISVYYPGTLNGNQEIIRLNVVRAFLLRANCLGSIATLGTAATSSAVFKIKRNGSQIGTFTFAASGAVASFSMSEQTFNVGDLLSLVAPTSPDATAAGLALSLLGLKLS